MYGKEKRKTQPQRDIDPLVSMGDKRISILKVLKLQEKGKTLFLYTDDTCSYQFYEHRDFERVEEKEIVTELPKGKVPLKCFIYS